MPWPCDHCLPPPPEPCRHPELKLCPQKTVAPLPSPAPSPREPLLHLRCSGSWLLSVPPGGIVQYLSLCVWLLTLGITSSRVVRVVAGVQMPLLLGLNNVPPHLLEKEIQVLPKGVIFFFPPGNGNTK